jgi:hypothetical protein
VVGAAAGAATALDAAWVVVAVVAVVVTTAGGEVVVNVGVGDGDRVVVRRVEDVVVVVMTSTGVGDSVGSTRA